MERSYKGFIVSELIIYILLGTIVLTVSLNLFKNAYEVDSNYRRTLGNINDFNVISERIKYDLLTDVTFFNLETEKLVSFKFLREEKGVLTEEDYTLVFNGEELYYLSGVRKLKLSDRMDNLFMEYNEGIFTIIIVYGEEVYERSFRIYEG